MSTQLHPADAKLVSAIAALFGGSLAVMGALMLATAGYENVRAAGPAVLMLWAGLVLILAGWRVRSSLRLLPKPKSFFLGFLLGLWSVIGSVINVAEESYGDAIVFLGLLLGSCYVLWTATDPVAQNQERYPDGK